MSIAATSSFEANICCSPLSLMSVIVLDSNASTNLGMMSSIRISTVSITSRARAMSKSGSVDKVSTAIPLTDNS